MILFKKIKKNNLIIQSAKTMALRIFGVITLFGFTLFLTHNYSPEIIGQYDFTRTFLLVFGTFCLLGTDQSILYFAGVVRGEENLFLLKIIYWKMFRLLSTTTLLALIFYIIFGKLLINTFFEDKEVYPLLFKAMLVFVFYGITFFNTEAFRALNRIYTAELFRNIFKYVSIIIGAVLLLEYKKESYLVDTFLIGFVILAMISTYMIWKIFQENEYTLKLTSNVIDVTYGSIIKKSYPMAISSTAIFLLMSIDIFFLKKYYGNSVVAYYSVAIKLITIISMIINTANVTVATKIAEYFASKNEEQLKKVVKQNARFIFIFSAPIVIITMLFPEFILNVFGSTYVEGKSTLLILITGQGVCSLMGAAPMYLNMTGRQRVFQRILVFVVFVNAIVNSILIPKYGMEGAAVTYLITFTFWNLCSVWVVYKQDRIKIFIH